MCRRISNGNYFISFSDVRVIFSTLCESLLRPQKSLFQSLRNWAFRRCCGSFPFVLGRRNYFFFSLSNVVVLLPLLERSVSRRPARPKKAACLAFVDLLHTRIYEHKRKENVFDPWGCCDRRLWTFHSFPFFPFFATILFSLPKMSLLTSTIVSCRPFQSRKDFLFKVGKLFHHFLVTSQCSLLPPTLAHSKMGHKNQQKEKKSLFSETKETAYKCTKTREKEPPGPPIRTPYRETQVLLTQSRWAATFFIPGPENELCTWTLQKRGEMTKTEIENRWKRWGEKKRSRNEFFSDHARRVARPHVKNMSECSKRTHYTSDAIFMRSGTTLFTQFFLPKHLINHFFSGLQKRLCPPSILPIIKFRN